MKKKKIYTAEEKTIILREHLENAMAISEIRHLPKRDIPLEEATFRAST